MPIFEYICNDCGEAFETIITGNKKAVCENCGSKKVEKQLSVFAAHQGGKNEMPPCAGGCGGFESGACGSGMCGGH